MPEWLDRVPEVLLRLLPWGLWCAWWLWAVNWPRAWPVLARGGWAPVLLLMAMAALVWSRLSPGEFLTLPNGAWQLGGVCALTALALFCGWLQGVLGWTPHDVDLEPPPAPHHH